MKAFRRLTVAVLALLALAGVIGSASAAGAWTGCRPDIDPETLEISTLCY